MSITEYHDHTHSTMISIPKTSATMIASHILIPMGATQVVNLLCGSPILQQTVYQKKLHTRYQSFINNYYHHSVDPV